MERAGRLATGRVEGEFVVVVWCRGVKTGKSNSSSSFSSSSTWDRGLVWALGL